MFPTMPLALAIIIVALLAFNSFIPLSIKAIAYALSLSIKSLIIFLLPFLIFGLLFKATTKLAGQAAKVIMLIFASVCCSNFISTIISRLVGMWVYHFDLSLALPATGQELIPAWSFQLSPLIANDKAMFGGVILGTLLAILQPKMASLIAHKLDLVVNKILSCISFLIPFFITGFTIKMYHDGSMTTIIKDYPLVFIVIAAAQFSYIAFLYLVATFFNVKKWLQSIKNMLPAAFAGFTTMSSAAAMPLTIVGTEKNAHDIDFARAIIPVTVNIHLIGDCFAIPIFAYAILKSYGLAEPAFFDYLYFAFYFILAKFSVAAVPGGGIIVMLPILQAYLGFSGEMLSLITALYFLFDPVITCANVLGNGAFAIVISKLRPLMIKNKPIHQN